jgi:hypothetical protein
MNIIKHFLFFFSLINFLSITYAQEAKINGMSMVASRSTLSQTQAERLNHTGSNFVAVMPYAFMPDAYSPRLFYDTERQWSGETLKGIESDIKTLQKQGLQVMLKPHIWIGNGVFTGKISMRSEADWAEFEDRYTSYILEFAKLAEQHQVSLFCIGTELNAFTIERTDFWCGLIEEVKAIYSGQLTYAENWDKYDTVGFWDSLDFIGIDAYFPISESQTPNLDEVISSWSSLKWDLESYSRFYETPILFTEYGYRSIDYSGKEPWDSSRNEGTANEKAQLILLKGLHQSLWKEDWFAGGFLWKWFPNYNVNNKRHRNRFTVQNKLSETYLKSFYSR